MAEIRFRDDAGWQWAVVEHSNRRKASADPSSRGQTLYFLSRYETRRCDDYPPDWAKRPPKELKHLCDVAKPL